MVTSQVPVSDDEHRIRIFVVDDSVVVRGLLARWIDSEPDLVLAGSAADGSQAIRKLADIEADVCILDLEMPIMGGLEALPTLLRLRPDLKVLVASRLAHRGAEVALQALTLGAADYVPKPDTSGLGGADTFRRELFARARALAPANGRMRRSGAADSTEAAAMPNTLRAFPANLRPPEILAVGASTGGPQALQLFARELRGRWRAPVLVVQHMPEAFIALLAAQLGKASGLPSSVPADGTMLLPGQIYVAPSDYHLRVTRVGGQAVARLDQAPPDNFCRPSVDALFQSVAAAYGDRALGVVLTGMGRDGQTGSGAIVGAGGVVMVQDELSSVVWGMPGAVAKAGLASAVKSVEDLAAAAIRLAAGERP